MNRKFFNLFILLFFVQGFIPYQLKAQDSYDLESLFITDRTIGTTRVEFLSKVLVLDNGEVIYAGKSSINGGDDYWLVKTDLLGDEIWAKTFGGDNTDNLRDILELDNGDLLLVGWSFSGVSGDKTEPAIGVYDGWVIRVDANGNKVWDRTLGTTDPDVLNSAVELSDGTILLGGNIQKINNSDYWLINLDAQGNVLWQKTVGGANEDALKKIILLPNDEFLVAGASSSGISGDRTAASKGGTDYWVLKFDHEGNIIWDKAFGGRLSDNLEDMIALSDGSFLLGGSSTSDASGDKTEDNRTLSTSTSSFDDYWLVKMNDQGDKVWDKTIGGTELDYLRSMLELPDGSMLIGGFSHSPEGAEKSENVRGTFPPSPDYWLVRLNDQGDKIWDKTLGGASDDRLATMALTKDGNFILGGTSFSSKGFEKSEDSKGVSDFWIIQFRNDFQAANSEVQIFDADTQQSIQTLQDGDEIQLESVGTDFFSLALGEKSDFGSVQFKLEGPIELTRTENTPPFSLFGKKGTGLVGRNFPEGDYKLHITPYSANLLQGQKAETITYSFSVLGEVAVPSIEQFVLVDADTDQDIQVIEAGSVINLDDLSTRRLSIRAELPSVQVGSVSLELISNQLNHTQTENLAPYALFGGEPITNYFGKVFPAGEYTLKANAFSEANLNGVAGEIAEINFTIFDNRITQVVEVDALSGEDIGELQNGAVFGCKESFSVRAEAKWNVQSVQFILTRDGNEVINRTENFAPYTLFGEDFSGDIYPI